MGLRYRCLVVDHDDTSVMSTPSLHYPAHVEALSVSCGRARAHRSGGMAREEFRSGFYPLPYGELGHEEAEVRQSDLIWRELTAARACQRSFRASSNIRRVEAARRTLVVDLPFRGLDDRARLSGRRSSLADGEAVVPDSSSAGTTTREAQARSYPLLETMRSFGYAKERYSCSTTKPGADMAAAAGVDFAAAGWGHAIEEIKRGMRGLGKYYFEKVENTLRPLRPVIIEVRQIPSLAVLASIAGRRGAKSVYYSLDGIALRFREIDSLPQHCC